MIATDFKRGSTMSLYSRSASRGFGGKCPSREIFFPTTIFLWDPKGRQGFSRLRKHQYLEETTKNFRRRKALKIIMGRVSGAIDAWGGVDD